jgi:glutathione peroxidase-family protein
MGNKASSEAVAKPMNIFDHTVEDIEGNPFPLEQVRGAKGYLVVNVASA